MTCLFETRLMKQGDVEIVMAVLQPCWPAADRKERWPRPASRAPSTRSKKDCHLRELFGRCSRYSGQAVSGPEGLVVASDHRRSAMAHDKIAPLTVQEM